MPELSRISRWEKYIPNIGDNRSQEKPFYLLVASGITYQELDDFKARSKEFKADGDAITQIEAVFGDLVKMGEEPLSVSGVKVETFHAYLDLLSKSSGGQPVMELVAAVSWFNSTEGSRELFYGRLSGGTAFTTSRKAASDERPRVVQ